MLRHRDRDPHQGERWDPDPHQSEKVETLQDHYGALGVQIWKKVSGKIRIRIKLKGRIRIRISVKGRIRIRIKVKSMTRFRIEVIRIRNTELSYTLWGTVYTWTIVSFLCGT
jgi:hypothetical protein